MYMIRSGMISLLNMMAGCLHCPTDELTICHMHVQHQTNNSDCGLFARYYKKNILVSFWTHSTCEYNSVCCRIFSSIDSNREETGHDQYLRGYEGLVNNFISNIAASMLHVITSENPAT